MIESGEKKEEYREITNYWDKRLTDKGVIKRFTHVHFSLGYPHKDDASRNIIKEIEILPLLLVFPNGVPNPISRIL